MVDAVRPVRLVGLVLFVIGLVLLAVGFLQGEATLVLFVIFPVVTASGLWSVLGILLVIAGFFLSFLGFASTMEAPVPPPSSPEPSAAAPPSPAPPQKRWGGVVLLGPIPILFGSDPKFAWWMVLVGALLVVGLVVLTIIALRGI